MSGAAYPRDRLLGVILAGGKARRMGGQNKALVPLDGRPLIEHVLERINPQCGQIVISSNDEAAGYAHLHRPVIADSLPDQAGPIAGILAAMEWARIQLPECEWILSAPVDCPFLPGDLAKRLVLAASAEDKPIALAASGERTHFVCGLWHVSQCKQIRNLLEIEKIRRAETIAGACGFATAVWDAEPADPFFNINTESDLAAAEKQLTAK